MKVLKYKYNPDKKGVFRVSIVKNPAVGEGDLVLMSAVDLEPKDGDITTYADMLVRNNDGKILLLKRNETSTFEPNKWGFPGGKVMPGETTKNGSIRECLEECGVDVENVESIGEIVNDDNTTSHYFSGTPTNDIKLGDEHQEFAWVNSEELKDYDLILNNEDRFKKLIDGEVVEMSAQEIKGVFYSPVMIPDLNIQRIGEDGEKYMVYYDAETVEQLANNYFKQNGNRGTNLEHEADNAEGVYPVESWIVKDPDNDKSKALGMPLQKEGTWIMGYKCESPELLEQIKNNLLQGLSIEGHLDMEEDTDSPIAKFNKQTMSLKKLMDGFEAFKTVLMAAEEEAKSEEKTAEEIAAEEEKKKAEMAAADEEAAKAAEEAKAKEDEGAEPTEIETLKATIEELEKKNADLEAELATYKNDATLMSAQLEDVKAAFESYKAVKMSSQKLGDQPKELVVLSAADAKAAKFLEDVKSKL